jgi:hypothetical protein
VRKHSALILGVAVLHRFQKCTVFPKPSGELLLSLAACKDVADVNDADHFIAVENGMGIFVYSVDTKSAEGVLGVACMRDRRIAAVKAPTVSSLAGLEGFTYGGCVNGLLMRERERGVPVFPEKENAHVQVCAVRQALEQIVESGIIHIFSSLE